MRYNRRKQKTAGGWRMPVLSVALALIAVLGFGRVGADIFGWSRPVSSPETLAVSAAEPAAALSSKGAVETAVPAAEATPEGAGTSASAKETFAPEPGNSFNPEAAGFFDASSSSPDEDGSFRASPSPGAETRPAPLAGLSIGIDPGHQKKANNEKEPVKPGGREKKPKVSGGTRGVRTKIPEYVTDLEIAFRLRDVLLSLGAEVLMTRETHEVDISNVERAVMMNEWGADLVLRIHCNGVNKRSANGIGLYVTKTGSIADSSRAAALAILPRMLEATGARKDGIFQRDTYSGLNWSSVPCILVENGYMTNPEEDEKLNDPLYQQSLARGMAQGIADWFGREITEEDWGAEDAQ